MKQLTYGTSTGVGGFIALGDLVYASRVAIADLHVAGAPCRPWSGSAVTEILGLFGNGRSAMLAKIDPRLKEPST